ncbi:MAG TPA: hypothetical protein VMB21_10790 [Candidatus Limnocylindria bacterium]|jgi:hypothetical protein|nr:hypothetical protein [Candidatus Limnocylindria bacterium]
MNYDQLQQSLLQVARQDVPSEQVPYAFESRIMARLVSAPVDVLTEWTAAFWRMALSSLAVAAVASIINFSTPTVVSDESGVAEVAAADLDTFTATAVEVPSETW